MTERCDMYRFLRRCGGVCVMVLWMVMPVVAEPGHAAGEPSAAAPKAGPFLRVTALEPAPDGVVFRVGWSHPYRSAGAHAPVAAGHLSRVFTPPPRPKQKPKPKAEKFDANIAVATEKELDMGPYDDFGDPLADAIAEEKEAERRKKEAEEAAAGPILPTVLLYNDRAEPWLHAEALFPENRLKAGDPSAPMDMWPILPRQSIGMWDQPLAHQAMILYVRAFAGPELKAVRLPIRLEIFIDADAPEPVSIVEVVSGHTGITLTEPESESPRLETEQMLRERWIGGTRWILANRAGREFFASPAGKPKAKGTRQDPFELQAALSGECGITAGDTLWLLGGVYEAPGHEKPAPVKKVKREADAKTEPQAAKPFAPKHTLVTDHAMEDDDLFGESLDDVLEGSGLKKVKPKPKPKPIPMVTRHYYTSGLVGMADQPVIVRQYPGERAKIHGGFTLGGKHTWLWGFEIAETGQRANSPEIGSFLSDGRQGCRLINLHLHGGWTGAHKSASTVDAEMYGCILHDAGYWPEVDRDSEHFIPGKGLTLDSTGAVLRINDNIIFNGYGPNIYGPGASEQLANLYMEGNFVFSAGMKGEDWSEWNVRFGWHDPVHRVFFIDNVFYHPLATQANVQFAAFQWHASGELVVRGNVFDGGKMPLLLGGWSSCHAMGNTFRSAGSFVTVSMHGPKEDAFVWDKNTYVALPAAEGREDVGALRFHPHGRKSDFDAWRETTGFDANSRLLEGKDIDTRVIVRPNMYEPGRAHVAVIPWGKKQAVPADLAPALKKGDRFVIYNVQNLDKPVVEGEFNGKAVMLPRGNTPLAPDFDAYLVVPVN